MFLSDFTDFLLTIHENNFWGCQGVKNNLTGGETQNTIHNWGGKKPLIVYEIHLELNYY